MHSKRNVAAAQETHIKEFLDMISPGIIKFNTDHIICGNTYRCVWALREYPTTTDEQAILRHLGEKDGVTLRIYTRQVTPAEEKRIIHNAANKNRMAGSNTNDLQQTVTAESNLQDVTTLVSTMHRNREPLLHCAVYIELIAHEYDALKLLQTDVLTELVRSKLNDCLAGKIDYIITKSVSRFARNTVDCLDHVRILKSRGIGIFFEEQNIDTLKIDSELYLVIYAGFAQSESESMSKNITWSYRKKFEDGNAIFMYKKLLGYKKGEDGMPEVVPEEASIVMRIFNMYLAGNTPARISTVLKSENTEVPGKSFSFSSSMIANVLANEKYCGDSILQKTVTVDCISKTRRKNTGEAPMYYVQNSHPAIISRETFHKAQEELIRRKTVAPKSSKTSITYTGKYSKFALTDVLICGECGSRYKRVTWTAYKQKRVVWRCISRLDYGKKYCKESITIDEIALQNAIMRALNRFNEEDRATYMALMKATIGEAIGLNGSSDEVDLLQRKVDALNRKMIELINESVRTGNDIESREDEFKQISDTIALLKNRINAIQEVTSSDNSPNDRLDQIQRVITEREQSGFQYDDSIVRQMIECIKVYPSGKLDIIFGGGYIVEENIAVD